MVDAERLEREALIANDIRVLTGQLNDVMRLGAEAGLRITIETSTVLDVKGAATTYPTLAVRVQSEVR